MGRGCPLEITEVRVKLAPPDVPGRSAKLKAFATVTFDDSFVVRDIKVILGARGLFVAMPSRRLTARCPRCRAKNHLHAGYCNECGLRLSGRSHRVPELDHRGRAKLHADVAHPINRSCRSLLQKAIVEAYREELEKSRQAGYEPPTYEFPQDAGPEDEFAEAAECCKSTPLGPEGTGPGDAEESGGSPEETRVAGGGSLEEAGPCRRRAAAEEAGESDDGDSEADADLGIFG